MIDPDALLAIPLLAGLNDAARRELAARSTTRTFAPGEVLWSAGAEPRGFFVVLEGEVRVVRSVGGRQHVVHVEGPGGTLGDVALFAGERYPATAIASRRTTCVAVTRDGLLAAIRQDPELALALLGRLAGRVRHLIGRLDGATSRSVTARLAAYLLARRERAGRDTFPLGRTQAQVAEELGTVREVVVRTLRSLRDQGVIRAEPRGALTVLDVGRLAELANT
jgi:CRP/FNR family transcriptional regulator